MDPRQDIASKISEETRIEMLRRNWLSHDAKWQMAVVSKYGWNLGNYLNQKVTREIGKIMMLRFMKNAGISGINDANELRDILVTTISLNYPEAMDKNLVICQPDGSILFEINNCAIYNNIKKKRATGSYECGCFALRSGFCDALKLEISHECETCLMKGDKKCEIVLKVEKW
ncbi:MAG: hypothetical protein RBG13Loki_3514 [Promethearchaeota archaeon CR_4]|nr:MAG: hypothetical protein RBG13Loki_3514 [Candidatus Lokiarchaeota archaeon CR_4]